MKKRIISWLLVITMLAQPITVKAELKNIEKEQEISEINEDDIDLNENENGLESENDGRILNYEDYIPKGIEEADDVSVEEYFSDELKDLPSSYDSRDYGVVTSVKDQGKNGICWTYACMSALESAMIIKGLDSNPDLSERHLAYYSYDSKGAEDTLLNSVGDYTENDTKELGGSVYEFGGNQFKAARMLANWGGAMNESAFPAYTELMEDLDVSSDALYGRVTISGNETRPAVHIKSFDFISMTNDANTDIVKRKIMENGALAFSYYDDQKYASKTEDGTRGCSYYNYEISSGTNHAVCLVGWDDNYSRDNFNPDHKPLKDGAWLIKNSWGVDQFKDANGNSTNGYMWLSYEDKVFESGVAAASVYEVENISKYDRNYFYAGSNDVYTIVNSYTAGEVFEAKADEILSAVSIYTDNQDIDMSFQIYKNPVEEGNPESGKPMLKETQKVHVPFIGYHSFELDKDLIIDNSLKKGDRFAVVFVFNGSKVYVGAEENRSYQVSAQDSLGNDVKCTVTYHSAQNEGQCFYKANSEGDWIDLGEYDISFRINAFTNNMEDCHSVNYILNGGSNSKENPVVYTASQNKIVLKDITRTGYDFEGWYTDFSLSESSKVKNNEFDVSSKNEDITFYAKFTPHKYKLTVNANGGTFDDGEEVKVFDITYDEKYTDLLSKIELKKDGKCLKGFAGEDNLLIKNYRKYNIEGDQVIHAEWVARDENVPSPIVKSDDIVFVGKDNDGAECYKAIQGKSKVYLTAPGDKYKLKIRYATDSVDEIIDRTNMTLGFVNFKNRIEVQTVSLYDDTECSDVRVMKFEKADSIDSEFAIMVDDAYYNGLKQMPKVTVMEGVTVLEEGCDYTLSYSNNVNVNEDLTANNAPKVTVTGKGNYSGTVTKRFKIHKRTVSQNDLNGALTYESKVFSYKNGSVYKKSPDIYLDGKKLVLNKDYTVLYDEKGYSETGEYPVKIQLKGSYCSLPEDGITIPDAVIVTNKKNLSAASIKGIKASNPYEGKEIKFDDIKVSFSVKEELVQGEDYEVSYLNNNAVGTAAVKITAKASSTKCVGSKTVKFKITGKKINTARVSGLNSSYEYTGYVICPSFELVLSDNSTLTKENYSVAYRNNINAGMATVTITGKGLYEGTIKKTFRITPQDISKEDSLVSSSYSIDNIYVKGGVKPEVSLKHFYDDGRVNYTLTLGKDYTVTYKNYDCINTDYKGDVITDNAILKKLPCIKVTGKGNYKGTKILYYNINIRDTSVNKVSVYCPEKGFVNKKGNYKSVPVIIDTNGKSLVNNVDFYIEGYYKSSSLSDKLSNTDIVSVGEKIYCNVIYKGHYTGNTSVPFYICEKDFSQVNIRLKNSVVEYSGEEIKFDPSDIYVTYKGKPVPYNAGDQEYETSELGYCIWRYVNNIEPGYGELYLYGNYDENGKGFGGMKSVRFKIVKKNGKSESKKING